MAKSNNSFENKTGVKKVRLSIPIQETGGPPSPSSKKKLLPDQSVTSVTGKQELAKNIPQSPKTNPIVKRESFRGSEISDPVLVCTTNRNSLVLADGKVDIIGPEAKLVSKSPTLNRSSVITVKRSQSERPVSRPDPLRPPFVPPVPTGSTLKKSESARSPTRVNTPAGSATAKPNSSGFRSRPVPPLPTFEDDDTQPIYTNESADMSDLLSAIQGALKDSCNIYTNVPLNDGIHSSIQETAPPAPPRPSWTNKTVTQSNGENAAAEKATGSLSQKTNNIQKPLILGLVSQKLVTDPKSETSTTPSINSDRQNNADTCNQPPPAQTTSPSGASKKPVVTSTKPGVMSTNSLKMKDNISNELKSKILSRSNTSAAAQASNSVPQKSRTPSSSSNSNITQKVSTTSSLAAGKDKPTKTSNSDAQKAPVSKTGKISDHLVKKEMAAKVPPHTDTNHSSATSGLHKPSQFKAKTSSSAPVAKALTFSSSDTRKTSGSTPDSSENITGGRNNPKNANRDKILPEPKSAQPMNVSNLAAKFAQTSDGTSGKPAPVQSSEDIRQRIINIKGPQAEKPATVSRPKITTPKPEISQQPSFSSKTENSSRPTLPPKPGDPGFVTPAASAAINAQPKRVQSFRI